MAPHLEAGPGLLPGPGLGSEGMKDALPREGGPDGLGHTERGQRALVHPYLVEAVDPRQMPQMLDRGGEDAVDPVGGIDPRGSNDSYGVPASFKVFHLSVQRHARIEGEIADKLSRLGPPSGEGRVA